MKTDDSKETTLANLRNVFSAQVVLINHENKLPVDTACSNIAIKFNMLYLSVHQLIKEHIHNDTPVGQQLQATYNPKELQSSVQEDESGDQNFSPVHYDLNLVI